MRERESEEKTPNALFIGTTLSVEIFLVHTHFLCSVAIKAQFAIIPK